MPLSVTGQVLLQSKELETCRNRGNHVFQGKQMKIRLLVRFPGGILPYSVFRPILSLVLSPWPNPFIENYFLNEDSDSSAIQISFQNQLLIHRCDRVPPISTYEQFADEKTFCSTPNTVLRPNSPL
jgi:hypothetical protein